MRLNIPHSPKALQAFVLGILLAMSTAATGQVTDPVAAVEFGPWASDEVKALGDTAQDSSRLESFWARVREQGTPIIERDPNDRDSILVTFVVQGPAGYRNPVPSVHGTYGWHDLYSLENVPNSDIWMKTLRFPAAARTAYWLAWPRGRVADPNALDVFKVFRGGDRPAQEVYRDPLSVHDATYFSTATGQTGLYSWFEGPDAPRQPFLEPGAQLPGGTIENRIVASKLLDNSRDVSIYTPAGYGSDAWHRYPFLLMFDRDEYLATVQVPQLLDAMIDAKAIPPLVAAFVDVIGYEERGRELPGNPQFQQFVHDELLPMLERDYFITRDPSKRVVAGASFGGLCATLIAQRYPESFGAVLSQSGSFWWGPEFSRAGSPARYMDYGDVPRKFAESPRLPIRFSFDVGLLEPDMLINTNRQLRDVLVAKGYDVDYSEIMGAHDWVAWRGSLPNRLIALLGPATIL